MDERISLVEFKKFIEQAQYQFPTAKVMSVGTGIENGHWYYAVFLKYEGKEIKFKIPCYENEVN